MGIPAMVFCEYPLPAGYEHLQNRNFQTKSLFRSMSLVYIIESEAKYVPVEYQQHHQHYTLQMYSGGKWDSTTQTYTKGDYLGNFTPDNDFSFCFHDYGVTFRALFKNWHCVGIEVVEP